MIYSQLPGDNGAGSKLTVTSTATSLQDLIRTASGDKSFVIKGQDVIAYTCPLGSAANIRWFADGNIPTSELGTLVEIGDSATKYGLDMSKVMLISDGGDTTLEVAIGKSSVGMPTDSYGMGAVTLEAGDISLGAVEIKDGSSAQKATVNGAGELLVSSAGAAALQELAAQPTGQDAYTTILTAGVSASHIKVSLSGSNDATISVDGGTTNGFDVPANSIVILDGLSIGAGAAIQAKNETAGQDYTKLSITIW